MANKHRTYFQWIRATFILAFLVTLSTTYIQLNNPHFSCPLYPNCFNKPLFLSGFLINLKEFFGINAININLIQLFHNYCTAALGLFIIALAILSYLYRNFHITSAVTPGLLILLFVFQVGFSLLESRDLWLPMSLITQILVGTITISILWFILISTTQPLVQPNYSLQTLKPWAIIALILIFIEIFLNTWINGNLIALTCSNTPFCHAHIFPLLNTHDAPPPLSGLITYSSAKHIAQASQHSLEMTHNYSTFFITAYLMPFALCLILIKNFSHVEKLGWLLLLMLAAQLLLTTLQIFSTALLIMQAAVVYGILLIIISLLRHIYTKPTRAAG